MTDLHKKIATGLVSLVLMLPALTLCVTGVAYSGFGIRNANAIFDALLANPWTHPLFFPPVVLGGPLIIMVFHTLSIVGLKFGKEDGSIVVSFVIRGTRTNIIPLAGAGMVIGLIVCYLFVENVLAKSEETGIAFMPEFAPVVVLAFLSTCFVLLAAAAVSAHAAIVRQWRRLKIVLAGTGGILGLYLCVLFLFSLTGHERVLNQGERKHFCEIDCHLAYSVENVTQVNAIGTPPYQTTAKGTFCIVTVKTWFDERTISSRRGNAPLKPNPRLVTVVSDGQGRQYGLSLEGQHALEEDQGKGTPLTQSLRPGESYTTGLVFDLPSSTTNPRLLITDSDWITHVLIGYENSLFHKKILFRL